MRFYEVIFFYFRIIAVIGEKKKNYRTKDCHSHITTFFKISLCLRTYHNADGTAQRWKDLQLTSCYLILHAYWKQRSFCWFKVREVPPVPTFYCAGPESACKIYTVLLKLSLSALFLFHWHLYVLTFLSLLQCSHRMWTLSSASPPPWSPSPLLMSSNSITWGILGWLNTLTPPLICNFQWYACE